MFCMLKFQLIVYIMNTKLSTNCQSNSLCTALHTEYCMMKKHNYSAPLILVTPDWTLNRPI